MFPWMEPPSALPRGKIHHSRPQGGDTLSIVIIREGKTMTVEAALQENKPDTSSNDENTAGGNNGQGSGGQDSQQTPEDSQGGSLRDC